MKLLLQLTNYCKNMDSSYHARISSILKLLVKQIKYAMTLNLGVDRILRTGEPVITQLLLQLLPFLAITLLSLQICSIRVLPLLLVNQYYLLGQAEKYFVGVCCLAAKKLCSNCINGCCWNINIDII